MPISMRRFEVRVLIGCAALLTAFAVTAAAPPPPAEAFGHLPAIQFAQISPDGSLIAIDATPASGRQIAVWEVDTGKVRRVINLDPASKLRGLHWAGNQTLLVDASIEKGMECNASTRCAYEWLRTMAIDMNGAPPRLMLLNDAARQFATGASLLATNTGRPDSITMETWDWSATNVRQTTGTRLAGTERDTSGWIRVVFDVDTRTGKGRPLAAGTPYTQNWVVDAQGLPWARSEWDPKRRDFAILARTGDRWREIYHTTDGTQLDLAGLSMDGRSIVALGANGGERSKAWSIPLDGTPASVLWEEPDRDVDGAYVDPYTNLVIGLGGGSRHWLDAKVAMQQRSLESAFSGRRVEQVSRSWNGQRVVVRVDNASRPPAYHLVDFDKSRADLIGDAYPELAHTPLGSVQFIHYPARDGTSIPAYLTLPPGRSPKNLPVVVLPHGGPEARDSDGFDWLAQFLATRGYAVLQPQFRGSTGFGEGFRRAGYRQWGKRMQDDVTDGVRHLVADGTADAKRICIVGGSYGGYAALAGAAFTPELYACAASIGGVSDLPQFLVQERRQHGGDSDPIAYWYDHIGPPGDPDIAKYSPARSARTFAAPVLLLHGVEDSVVPIGQSETMARALQAAGKQVTFVQLPGEDHWLSRAETRIRVLKELETFLAQSLQPH